MDNKNGFIDTKYDSPGARIGCLASVVVIIIFIVLAILYRNSEAARSSFIFIAITISFVSSVVILAVNGKAKQRNYNAFLESLPEIKISAKVVSKTSEVKKEYGKNASIDTIYYISFQLSDNFRKNLMVDVSTYNTIMESESGILTYKENGDTFLFVNFQNQS